MKTFLLAFLALAASALASDPIDWQAVAVKNFPDLAKVDSELNARFLRGVEQFKKSQPDFFKSPNWPLTLARMAAPAVKPFRGLGLSEKEIIANYGPCTEIQAFAPATRAIRARKIDYSAEFFFADGRCVEVLFDRVSGNFTREETIEMLHTVADAGWVISDSGLYWERSIGLGVPNNPGEKRWRYEPKFCDLIARSAGGTMSITTRMYERDFHAVSAALRK